MSDEPRWPLSKRTVLDWIEDYWLVATIGLVIGAIIGCAISW